MKLVWGNEKQFQLSELGQSFIQTKKSYEIEQTQIMFLMRTEKQVGNVQLTIDTWNSVPVILSR